MLKNVVMGKEQIEAILPHRGEWLMIDSAELEREVNRLTVEYHVPENPNWAIGHFPGKPIMPGVLLAEVGNQAFALLALLSSSENQTESLTILDSGSFKIHSLVKPGQSLIIVADFDASQEVDKRERAGRYSIYLKKNEETKKLVCIGTVTGEMVPKRLLNKL